MREKISLSALCLLSVIQAYASDIVKPDIFQIKQGTEILFINALSDNGKWALSVTNAGEDGDNPYAAGGVLIDVETRVLTKVDTPSGFANVNDVTDAGLIVGSEANKPAYWSPDTKSWTKLPINDNQCDIGSLIAVTPDGRLAVGYLGSSSSQMIAKPILYDLVANKEVPLENMPYRGMDGTDFQQTYLMDISADGRYLLGSVATSYLMWDERAVMWSFIYDTEVQDYSPIGFDLDKISWRWTPQVENLYMIMSQKLSSNGQFVTGKAYFSTNGGDLAGGSEGRLAYLYDVVNKKIELIDGENEIDYQGDQVLNDGTVIASAPSENPYPMAFVRTDKFYIGFNQILEQVYGMNLENYNGDGISGRCTAVSADGHTMAMNSYDNCYLMKLTEDLKEMASNVDLLADFTLSVPDGTVMTNFSEIDITFQRAIGTTNDYNSIKVYDSTGAVWATALSSTAISNDNEKKFHISFRKKQMIEGETYTIVIPAGYLYLKEEPSIKNHEISFSYVGRGNSTLEPIRITPSNDTNIAQFSSNNLLQLTFDVPIKINEDYKALLYLEGQTVPLASLSAAYEDQIAVFYPATTQYLYEGSDYYVVIGANSITDLSGEGGNQEIRLYYSGAYVRSVSTDEKYIFYEDFDPSSATWTTNFMYWQTEWNTPAEVPSSWNFTAETSWNTVRDNEESLDQAIASHSMFTPAGTADKWMMTPRIFIPDENCYLAFDAQSYLKSKNDVLKVYVYTSDTVYNLVTSEMVDELAADIRENADLIFDVTLSPGATEENLAEEWEHFIFELSDYAGKDIYILFNNNNEDQSAIFIDNVVVARNFAFLASLTTPESVVSQESIAIRGILTVDDDLATFSTADLILKNSDGEIVDRIEEDGLSLSKGDKYLFEFNEELPLTIGEINKYTLDLSLGDEKVTINQSIKNLAFEPIRKVVLEEISGATCGNCPRGFVAVDYILNLYPNNFIPLVLRVYGGDPNGTGLWSSVTTYANNILTSNQAPLGTVDRLGASSPMEQVGTQLSFSAEGLIDTETGLPIYTWADYVSKELSTPADGDIQFSVDYDESTGILSVPCSVRYAMNATGKNIGLFAVVTEDEVLSPQLNYLYNEEEPLYGEWGKGGIYSKYMLTDVSLDHIVRHPFTNAQLGEYLYATDFIAGQEYTQTLTTTLTDGVISDPHKCDVVVMMVDAVTGNVINANKARFGSSTTGINDTVIPENITNISLDRGKICVVSNQDVEVQVISINGLILAKEQATAERPLEIDMHNYHGIVIVAINGENISEVRKLIVR